MMGDALAVGVVTLLVMAVILGIARSMTEVELAMEAKARPKAAPDTDAPIHDRAAVTRRRNLITEAAELVRGLVDAEERQLFVKTLLEEEGPSSVGWLRLSLTPLDELAGTRRGQPAPRPAEAGTLRCPVTGNALLPGRVFFGLGNDARAKRVVNGLLSKHPADRLLAEAWLDTWADPQIARDVAGLAEMRGLTKVNRVRDPFMEIMLEAAMRREAEAKAKPRAARKAKAEDNAEAPVKAKTAPDADAPIQA